MKTMVQEWIRYAALCACAPTIDVTLLHARVEYQ
jgi:hypothetical protein